MLKRRIRIAIVSLSILALFIQGETARADPFSDIFRTLKRVFTEPPRKPARRVRHAQNPKAKSHDSSTGVANTPPSSHNTRSATRAPAAKAASDFPYAAPVPGKKGFVTSPFAPDSGYIDVSKFPPGTAVKDPYTGKIFLTP